MESIYSRQQWLWLLERRKDGYSYNALARFTGLASASIREHLLSINDGVKASLPPLETRKDEFNALLGGKA